MSDCKECLWDQGCSTCPITNLKDQLAQAQDTIDHLRGKAEFNMPGSMQGKHFNANNDPCDMIDGPCACGAWHSAREWVEKLQRKLDKAKEENQSFGNVLAVIHKDGGHYITRHGHDQASKDAIKIVLKLREGK